MTTICPGSEKYFTEEGKKNDLTIRAFVWLDKNLAVYRDKHLKILINKIKGSFSGFSLAQWSLFNRAIQKKKKYIKNTVECQSIQSERDERKETKLVQFKIRT